MGISDSCESAIDNDQPGRMDGEAQGFPCGSGCSGRFLHSKKGRFGLDTVIHECLFLADSCLWLPGEIGRSLPNR